MKKKTQIELWQPTNYRPLCQAKKHNRCYVLLKWMKKYVNAIEHIAQKKSK